MALPKSFVWGAGGAMLTPEELAKEKELEAKLASQAVDTSPVGHWTQGLARVANALAGSVRRGQIDDQIEANNAYNTQQYGDITKALLGGSSPSPAAAPMPTPSMGAQAAATAPGVAVPSSANAAEIRDGLIKRGLPGHVADAFVVNFQDESGLNPAINEKAPLVPGSRGGYGLYQLTGPRRVAYEQFAQQRGVDPADTNAQLDFLMTELQGPEASAAKGILSAPDTATAAQAIARDFLRPAPQNLEPRLARYAKLSGVAQPVEVASADTASPVGYASLQPMNSASAAIDAQAKPSGYIDPRVSVQPSLRPFKAGETRPNADGSYSTEISTTWQLPDGKWVNVPSLWMGDKGPQQFDPNDEQGILGAMQLYEKANGQTFQRFNSVDEAEAAARARSASGGAGAGPQQTASLPPLDAPRTIAPAPAVAPVQVAQAAPAPAMQADNGMLARAVQALSDPRANANTRQIAGVLLNQEMERQKAAREAAQRAAERQQQWAREDQRFAVTDRRAEAQDRLAQDRFSLEKEQAGTTADIKNYRFYEQRELAAGRKPLEPLEWEKAVRAAGATTNNVNVGGGSDKQIFDTMQASYDAARTAASGLNSLREARRAVEGGAILGVGADNRLALQKIGAQLGVTNPEAIINTETFRSAIAPQVAALMKQTVGSTQISNSDREFAEKAAGGSITLEKGTITRLLDIMERANTEVVQNHNDRLNRVYPDGQQFARERALFGVAAPQAPAANPNAAAINAAREAISRGADPAKVRERLQQNGIDPAGL